MDERTEEMKEKVGVAGQKPLIFHFILQMPISALFIDHFRQRWYSVDSPGPEESESDIISRSRAENTQNVAKIGVTSTSKTHNWLMLTLSQIATAQHYEGPEEASFLYRRGVG